MRSKISPEALEKIVRDRDYGTIRVLVVGDSTIMKRLISFAVKTLGVSTTELCNDGLAALHKIKTDPPDVVIFDMDTTSMNGIDFLYAIKKNDATFALPCILCMSAPSTNNVVQAIRAGVDHILVPPFTTESVEESVRNAIASPKKIVV